MIIGITGKIGSGKTTIARHLKTLGFEEYCFADPLKKIGSIFGFSNSQLYGTQEQKLEIHPFWKISARTFLQKVGTELFRENLPKIIPEMSNSVWVDIFKQKYQQSPRNYVISDVRFLDEANAIKELGGVIVRVQRNNNISSDNGVELIHASEMELSKIQEDFLIDNDANSIIESAKLLEKFIGYDNKYFIDEFDPEMVRQATNL